MCATRWSTGLIKEKLLGFSQLKVFDARSITDCLIIEKQLERHGIGYLKCAAQFYDGVEATKAGVGK